jgi:hypothetical protein
MKGLKQFAVVLLLCLVCIGMISAQITTVVKHRVLWTPTGTALWLKNDASTGSVGNGNPVPTWYDQSGNSRNATAAGTARPTYETNFQNGLPGLPFNGSSNHIGTGSFTLNQPVTVFIVGNMTTVNGYMVIDTTGSFLFYAPDSTHFGCFAGATLQQAVTSMSNVAVMGCVFNGGSPNSVNSYNGTEVTGNTGTSNGSGISLGGKPTGQSLCAGALLEVVVYASLADANLRACTEGYMAWKWGLQSNLPSGHAYKNAAPTTANNCS